MERVEHGIVAIITNHGFLDNPTFRGMRQNLLNTFDTLYFLDLHGNSNKKETASDGGKDENVFNIQQGVAISLLVKNPNAKQKGVFHADLYGRRNDKYAACLENNLTSVQWKNVKPAPPFYLFIPRDEKVAKEYQSLWSVPDIFNTTGTPAPGIVTTHDQFAISYTKKEVLDKIEKLLASNTEEEARSLFRLCSQKQWNYDVAKKALADGAYKEKACQIAYRPFDTRWTVYDSNVTVHRRDRVMRHILAGKNTGLSTVRQVKASRAWQHCLVATNLVESSFVSNKTGEITYLFPLYRYDIEMGETVRHENLKPEFRRWIDDRYGTAHPPENILGCIYAILHSPYYRNRYADFLRGDFPRIPFPADNAEFQRLATIGSELIAAHLLRENCTGDLAQHDGAGKSHLVEKIRYDEKTQRLYFQPNRLLRPRSPESFHLPNRRLPTPRQIPKVPQRPNLNPPRNRNPTKTANAIAFTLEKMGEIDG